MYPLGMSPTNITTMKVSKALRERISSAAASQGQTAQQFLEQVLNERDRRNRFAAVAEAMAEADPGVVDGWRAETELWESAEADPQG
jgi:predicted transcriptional regulator